jgi:hypothetical protein
VATVCPTFFFFAFRPFLRKILTSVPLLERFQKMDHELGAMDLGAVICGAEGVNVKFVM